MHFTLQNDDLLVTVASWGAELISLKGRQTGLEYLWQADPAVWGRHAPILFPIVGRLKDDQLHAEGKSYSMKQHGFARDSEFSCVEQHHERIQLKLVSNETTRSRFPYDFSLTVSYQLVANRLNVAYQVKNRQNSPIFFSIGAHPGLMCPLIPDSQFSDYFLEWEKEETLDRYYLADGLRNGESDRLMTQTDRLPLTHDLFADDALIVKSPLSEYIHLSHSQQGAVMTFHFANYPYLGIWSKPSPDASFVCIEPWHGIADPQEPSVDFTEKEGIRSLLPSGTFSCSYSIEIHPEAIG